MLATGATPNILQLRLSHFFVFTFAIALVLGIQTAIAIAVSRETYQQLTASLKPQIAALAFFDASAKAAALCGLFAVVMRQFQSVKYPAHPAEYLWTLMGLVVAMELLSGLWPYTPGGILYLVGGGIAAWLSCRIRWKCFYLLVAFSPFVMSIAWYAITDAFPNPPFYLPNLLLGIKEIAISGVLLGCTIGSNPTSSAWGGIISQFSRTAVSATVFVLMFFDLWQ